MNKLIGLLFILILIAGCRTTKKTLQSSEQTSNKIEVINETGKTTAVTNKNDKITEIESTTTKIEYFPSETGIESKTTKTTINPLSRIKSTEVTVIKTKIADKGVLESKSDESIKTNTAIQNDLKTDIKISESKKAKTQWGWMFGVLVICIIGFIYLNNRFKIILWIKNLFKKS